ncbi:Class II abasic (AP) endonuclease [Oleoguttula sp. CCFEE 5521]
MRNVNGVRNPFSYPPWNSARSFPAMFDILQSDIIVMQELKIQRKDLRDDMVMLDGWDAYFSLPKHKKGYSGVGMYTRNSACAPIRAEEGLLGFLPSLEASGVLYRDVDEKNSIGGYPSAAQLEDLGVDDPTALDAEGRCLILEFPAFVLLGVYCPANSNGQRDDFRHGFIRALDCRVRNLTKLGKRVVLVGDLNVNRDEMDGASALDDRRKGNISHEEYISTPNRRIFNQMLIGGEVIGQRDEGREEGVLLDTTRHFHPERRGMYTHWEQKINARPGNFGSRIDFILVCDAMREWLKDANTQDGLLGSDHCPVFLDFHEEVALEDRQVQLVDLMYAVGTSIDGNRETHLAPALSAKRMQEFDKRRSIKSMFAGASVKLAQPMAYTVRQQKQEQMDIPAERPMEESSLPPVTPTQAPGVFDLAPAVPRRTETVQSQSSPQSAPESKPVIDLKRKPHVETSPRVVKRQKSNSTTHNHSRPSGQQSLRGFFRSSSGNGTSGDTMSAITSGAGIDQINDQLPLTTSFAELTASSCPSGIGAPQTNDSKPQETAASTSKPSTPAPTTSERSPVPEASPTNFEARAATHHSWNSLFSKPAAPLCESHDEPCKSMQTKKKGSNQGRSFWMCARPLGPSGQKESGSEWRCGTFIWCSDWGGGRK